MHLIVQENTVDLYTVFVHTYSMGVVRRLYLHLGITRTRILVSCVICQYFIFSIATSPISEKGIQKVTGCKDEACKGG